MLKIGQAAGRGGDHGGLAAGWPAEQTPKADHLGELLADCLARAAAGSAGVGRAACVTLGSSERCDRQGTVPPPLQILKQLRDPAVADGSELRRPRS